MKYRNSDNNNITFIIFEKRNILIALNKLLPNNKHLIDILHIP